MNFFLTAAEAIEAIAPGAAAPLSSAPTTDAVAHALCEAGHLARAVWFAVEDLSSLRVPALLELQGGKWAVLVSVGLRRIRVLEADGRTTSRRRAQLEPLLTGYAVEACAPVDHQGRTRRLLWKGSVSAGRNALLWLIVACLSPLPAAVIPSLTRAFVDGIGADVPTVAWIPLGLFLLALWEGVLLWMGAELRSWLGAHLDIAVIGTMVDHVFRLELSSAWKWSKAEILESVFASWAIKEQALGGFIAFLTSLVSASAFLCLLAMQAPQWALPLLLGNLAAGGLAVAVAHWEAEFGVQQRAMNSGQRSALLESISGISTIKGQGLETGALLRWKRYFAREQSATHQRHRLETLRAGLRDLALGSSSIGLLFLGVAGSAGDVSAGTVLSNSQLGLGFATSIGTLALSISNLLTMRADALSMNRLLLEPKRRKEGSRIHDASVQVRGLSFRYAAADHFLFQDLSFDLAPRAKMHLSGASGSGKSTLLRILAGLTTPTEGSVRIGGVLTPCAGVLLLPQTISFFDGTIMDNLRLFSGDAPTARLLQVAEEAGLTEWVDTLPMGYNTLLTRGADAISAGQRQRIAFVAAAAADAQVLLLDEPMANLDPLSKARLLQMAGLQDKTILWTSHSTGHWTDAVMGAPDGTETLEIALGGRSRPV